jgi:aminobenzoyl-glutamate transport protein
MSATPTPHRPIGQRLLDGLERVGNKLPDPAAIFLIALVVTFLVSRVLSSVAFTEMDPRTIKRNEAGEVVSSEAIVIKNLISPAESTHFFTRMVKTYTDFAPLGVVLVAMLGVGVMERSGFIHAALKTVLPITPKYLLTPALLLVSIMSHTAADTGYVLVIPLGGLIFAAAGRHPVAGITVAFAGVSGGFSANFLPSALDPLLQSFTEASAHIIDPARSVNPLCNWYFMAASCSLIVGAGWFLNDRVLEPRLMEHLPVDGTGDEDQRDLHSMSDPERKGLYAAFWTLGLLILVLIGICYPASSPLRAPKTGGLTDHGAPLMEMIVPLIAVFAFIPGVVHGYVAKSFKNHRDVVKAMAESMNTMGYYLVMAFCAALFTYAFRESNLGALLAIKGAAVLKTLQLPGAITIIGIILLAAFVNLLVGSASAKWALLGPIFVPMLMQLGYSPELTQAAYRIGDSSTNILTPLLPYFPLIVVYCQRYSKRTGVGTLISTMLPYSICFMFLWTALLLIWWGLGIPLGIQSSYTP